MFKIEDTKVIIKEGLTFNQEYRIDKEGNVWTPYREWHIMSPSITKGNYYRIGLMSGKTRHFYQIHRLVLEAFLPREDSEELQVNHINGDKSDNSLSNLEWCDCSYNVKHAYDTKLHIPSKGEEVSTHILTEQDVLEIAQKINDGVLSYRQIGEQYGVTKHCVYDIKRKKSWGWLTKDFTF